jgi:hypothetical protein
MNYQRIYNNIIENAKSQNRKKGLTYYESHHIVPKSLGGSNKKENLVLLTPKEHFICHRLLIEIYKDDHKKYLSMLRAFVMLSSKNLHQKNRYINARMYENIKNKMYGTNGILTGSNSTFFGKSHNSETRKKLSEKKKGELNPQYNKTPWNKGKNKDNDVKIKEYSLKQKEHPYNKDRPEMSQETRKKLSDIAKNNDLGKNKSDSHIKNISKTMKNLVKTDPLYKQRLLENSKKAADVTRGVPKEKIKCPYCNKVGGKPAMKRFHFDKCKEKNNGT